MKAEALAETLFQQSKRLILQAGDEHALCAFLAQGSGYPDDLFRRLAGAVDDLGRPLAQGSMVVDLGVAEVGEGLALKRKQGIVDRDSPSASCSRMRLVSFAPRARTFLSLDSTVPEAR